MNKMLGNKKYILIFILPALVLFIDSVNNIRYIQFL